MEGIFPQGFVCFHVYVLYPQLNNVSDIFWHMGSSQ